ncbi:hypothetical protein [Paludisphaera borealis]|uniref:Uncharacterized protein n=1 Tax=Paludisphaera borealis TaxID=1387353 RepID=A0A1U7CKA0_9BACT|nr:hypothetical protein [Paludisphaera borealis]APW59336.1 hypothetical protein BSF38_00757 [Paludisphaera borealis]
MLRLIALAATLLLFAGDPPDFEPLGRFDLREIPESSGVVKSRRHSDVFWVHNDSGNPATLFAIDRRGRILNKFAIAVPNLDWEDLAIDGQGRLYIGDIGNNNGRLAIRMIHQIAEPDPGKPSAGPIKPLASSFYAMSRDDRFDAEALVVDGDRAIIVTKRFDGREAELREVSFNPPAPLLRPATARRIGVLPRFVESATGADLSADGRLLAVCGNRVTRVYERADARSWDKLRLLAEVFHEPLGTEGVAWDGMDLIHVSENRGVDRIAERVWRRASASATAGKTR